MEVQGSEKFECNAEDVTDALICSISQIYDPPLKTVHLNVINSRDEIFKNE